MKKKKTSDVSENNAQSNRIKLNRCVHFIAVYKEHILESREIMNAMFDNRE